MIILMKFQTKNLVAWSTLVSDPERVQARLANGETLLVMRNDEPFAVLQSPAVASHSGEARAAPSDAADHGDLSSLLDEEELPAPSLPRVHSRFRAENARGHWDDIPNKSEAVRQAAKQAARNSRDGTFTTNDVVDVLKERTSDVNVTTVRVYLIRDTVDHSSRSHYPAGQEDLWQTAGRGCFRPL
jgi:hypothetical protein